MSGVQPVQKGRSRYTVKKGSQHTMNPPTIIARVLAAFVSMRNRFACNLAFLFVAGPSLDLDEFSWHVPELAPSSSVAALMFVWESLRRDLSPKSVSRSPAAPTDVVIVGVRGVLENSRVSHKECECERVDPSPTFSVDVYEEELLRRPFFEVPVAGAPPAAPPPEPLLRYVLPFVLLAEDWMVDWRPR